MTYIGPLGAAQILNGFVRPRWDATTMVAIAGAESSWRTDAISPTNDYGVWQINASAWPELFANYNWWDPRDNAHMMNHVWSLQGYGAWTTYTSGAYQQYWQQAADAVAQAGGGGYSGGGGTPPSGPGGGSTSDIGDAIQTVARAFQSMADDDLWWSRRIDTMW
jgi:hypothetical protein